MIRLHFAAIALAMLVSACSGGGSRPSVVATSASSTPTEAATAASQPVLDPGAPEADGPDGFRQFARIVNLELSQGDIGFVTGRLKGMPYTCTTRDVPPAGLGGAACDYVGQQFEAFPIGHFASEGGRYPVEQAAMLVDRLKSESVPTASDAFGNGIPCVYAVGPRPGHYETVVTALITRPPDFVGSDQIRVVEVLTWKFDGTRWQAVGLLSAFVVAEELLTPTPDIDMYVPGWEKLAP